MRIVLILLFVGGCTAAPTQAPLSTQTKNGATPSTVVEHYHASSGDAYYSITVNTTQQKMMYSADSIVLSAEDDSETKLSKQSNEKLELTQAQRIAKVASTIDWNQMATAGCQETMHPPEDLPGDLWSVRTGNNTRSFWCPRGVTQPETLNGLKSMLGKWETSLSPSGIATMTNSRGHTH